MNAVAAACVCVCVPLLVVPVAVIAADAAAAVAAAAAAATAGNSCVFVLPLPLSHSLSHSHSRSHAVRRIDLRGACEQSDVSLIRRRRPMATDSLELAWPHTLQRLRGYHCRSRDAPDPQEMSRQTVCGATAEQARAGRGEGGGVEGKTGRNCVHDTHCVSLEQMSE